MANLKYRFFFFFRQMLDTRGYLRDLQFGFFTVIPGERGKMLFRDD